MFGKNTSAILQEFTCALGNSHDLVGFSCRSVHLCSRVNLSFRPFDCTWLALFCKSSSSADDSAVTMRLLQNSPYGTVILLSVLRGIMWALTMSLCFAFCAPMNARRSKFTPLTIFRQREQKISSDLPVSLCTAVGATTFCKNAIQICANAESVTSVNPHMDLHLGYDLNKKSHHCLATVRFLMVLLISCWSGALRKKPAGPSARARGSGREHHGSPHKCSRFPG
ncbi:hypothetical protein PhaeoP128_01751 [Phaeobacter gallaeciensis]|nr:hypothetical protein PhaeoP129_01751 [Phaeobacter gallaeciensis]ATF22490.1 hypothetical protein PhaeoP128_01751 [Phaeobacter gallaeciensis]